MTRGKQWITVDDFDLLDMPGVLWKKFDTLETATNLAFIGSIRDDILDIEELACGLLSLSLIHILSITISRMRSRKSRPLGRPGVH